MKIWLGLRDLFPACGTDCVAVFLGSDMMAHNIICCDYRYAITLVLVCLWKVMTISSSRQADFLKKSKK